MVALVRTVAYLGLEARSVEVQCSVAPGLPKFNIVGLADKAVGESKERVGAALSSMGLALPPKRITINLSPADLPKDRWWISEASEPESSAELLDRFHTLGAQGGRRFLVKLDHGLVDLIVDRKDMRSTLGNLLKYMTNGQTAAVA